MKPKFPWHAALIFGSVLIASALAYRISLGGELMACSAEPSGQDWHYRTKVPGYVGDVRGDRCWYDGPVMKPREELYWPEQAPPPPMVPIIVPQSRFEDFWNDSLREVERATR